MDRNHFIKKNKEFKEYLKKKGLSEKEIEQLYSIDELTDQLNFQFYDIDERVNSVNNIKGFEGNCTVNEVVTKEETYKEIAFESDAILCNRTIEGRTVGVETAFDNTLVIFLGNDYISFCDTTIKNQYYNGVYSAMREIYHYDIKDEIVDKSSESYEYEGRTFDYPIDFFDDYNPIASVRYYKEVNGFTNIELEGDAITSLGITYNDGKKPKDKVRYMVIDDEIRTWIDDREVDPDKINIEPENVINSFEDRYWVEDNELD